MVKKIYETGFILENDGTKRPLTNDETSRYDKYLRQAMKKLICTAKTRQERDK